MAAKSTISLGVEVTGGKAFQAELKACDSETKLLKAQLEELSSSLDKTGSKSSDNAAKMQNLAQQMQNQQQKASLLSAEIKRNSEALTKYAAELERAKQSGDPTAIEKATIAYENQRTKLQNLETNLSKTNTAMNGLKQSMDGIEASNTAGAFDKLKTSLDPVNQGFERIKSICQTLGPEFNALKTAVKSLAEGFVTVGKAALEAANAIINKMDAAVKGITVSATALVVGLGKVGLEYNAQMESYVTSFATMLGGTEAAVKKVEELKAMAAKTPFGMEDLAKATQTLLAFGVEADKTKPILQALGDVSLGNKDKFQSLALAFGQVSSAGKLTGQDLNQMINAGFNPLNEISKRTGESMEQLRDRMSKGGISAKEVEQAFIDATSAGGQFANGMENASKTTEGLISTLKDNATALVGQVFQPISDSIKNDLLPAALQYVDQLKNAFEKDGLPGIVNAVGNVLDDIMSKVKTAGPKIIDQSFEIVKQVLDRLKQSLPDFVRTGNEVIEHVMSGLRETLPKLGPIAAEVAPLIVRTILEYKGTLLDTGIQIIVQIVNGLADNMPSIMKTMQSGMDRLLDTILSNLPKFLDSAWKIIEQLVNGLLNNMDKVVNAITQIINALVNWITSHLELIINAATQIILALVKGLIQSIPTIAANMPSIVKAITDGLSTAVSEAFNIGRNITDGLIKGLLSLIPGVITATSGVADAVIKSAEDKLKTHSPSRVFMGIGENIGIGLAEGILGTAGIVQTALDNILPSAGNISMGMDVASVAGRVADGNGGYAPWVDNRPIILTLNDRELGRAVRGYV